MNSLLLRYIVTYFIYYIFRVLFPLLVLLWRGGETRRGVGVFRLFLCFTWP
jgi:hypothetical protein